MKRSITIISLIIAVVISSCEKYLAVDPPIDKLATNTVFADSASAALAMVGTYGRIMSSNSGFVGVQSRWAGLSADELGYSQSADDIIQFRDNNMQLDNNSLNALWVNLYTHVYQVNSVMEGVAASDGISISAKGALLAEAKFVRAFLYFYLVNNWGDVPLPLTTNYEINEKMPRMAQTSVYAQIVSDLLDARQGLSATYPTEERLRPNKWAATALLARVYLYTGQWQQAIAMSSEVIGDGAYLPLPAPAMTFQKGSRETIWQMMATSTNGFRYESYDGNAFVPASLTNAAIPVYLVPDAMYASFDADDLRRPNWIGSKTANPYYFPYKYKIRLTAVGAANTEYTVVFRLAEQYLIRAEARVQQNNIAEAVADLNVIRKRAGLNELSESLTKIEATMAVETERRHELFCEWGHRWYDLKRTGRATAVLEPVKGNNWQSTDVLWPIPLQQRLRNPFLTQNDGY